MRQRVRTALLLCLVLVGALLTAPPAAAAAGCPCTIWPAGAAPAVAAENDTAAVELGVRFRSEAAGYVTAVRFYKGAGNTGTHVGNLWTAAGANLGTVTFTTETATGWQTATFAAPIAISANTTYVASYYAPNGRYAVSSAAFAGTGAGAAPLHALRDGEDGANGVYRYGTGGGFPVNTWQASNYWVDVVFDTSGADTRAPTVTGTSPEPGAVEVPTTSTVSATLDEPLRTGTATLGVTGVSGATGYDAATRTVTFTPSAALATGATYTATVSGARDTAGNAMTPYTWSFTTASTSGPGCPCSIWPASATPATPAAADDNPIELGVRFRSATAGFVTGLRFYKGSGNTGTHTGTVWTAGGARLSTVTFTAETGAGWQNAVLPNPVPIAANTTYVASYHTESGYYSTTADGFAQPVTRGPLTATAGLYRYGAGAYPTDTYQNTNYWVDVVFDTTATDTVAPALTARAPAPGANAVTATTAVTATFGEPVTASSVDITLTGPSGPVAGVTGYDADTGTASFTPSAALAHSTGYTATVSGARDAAGNTMTSVTWGFTTAAPPPPPPDQGPGGPVLVVTSTAAGASGFTGFLAEVLRTEGLNEFATAGLSTLSAATLSQYDVVLLGRTPLTAAQVAMFTSWVGDGGNLIALRPDPQLAGLLGLTGGATTLAEGYLKVDTTTSPGAGITDQTIQYHGAADRYTLGSARAVATLHATATAATTNPAVSLNTVGAAGGQAAAFTYDLAQSLVQTRQGNPAWDGQERDGTAPRRSDDLYFGGSPGADWVNLAKVAIPQADEQQRLLANLIGAMNADRKPLPRFWYFPRGLKAVVVATGDDHATGGTAGRFEQYAANSATGCVVEDWQCARYTSYIFPNTPLTDSQARSYQSRGFEVGLHVDTGCADYTPSSIAGFYSAQLATWRGKYTGVTGPVSNRTHCLAWSDWSSQASTAAANGIRLDTNYYYWPGSWIANRPGFMTGSGMPMRFSGKTGGLIDVYQAATQMTDESGQSYPFTVNTLLDRALGAEGYYGAFTANIHTDAPTMFDSDQMLTSAQDREVPIITARQLLTWLDGRNASSYANVSFAGDALSFTVNVGAGANGLTGMVPTLGPAGTTLGTLTRAGAPVPFTRTTIKGVEYAMFPAASGAHVATYRATPAPAAVTAAVETTATSAEVTLTGGSGRTTIEYGTSADRLSSKVTDAVQGASRTVRLRGLQPGTAYWYRVRVTGPGGQSTDSPVGKLVTEAADTVPPATSGITVVARPDGTAAVSWDTSEQAAATLHAGASANALTEWPADLRGRRHTAVLTGLAPSATYHYRLRSADASGNVTWWPAPDRPPATFVSSAAGVADHTEAGLRAGSGSGTTVDAEGVRPADGARGGTLVSRVLDAGRMVTWDRLSYQATVPPGAGVRLFVRTGSIAIPGAGWTGWTRVGHGERVVGGSRYVQYRAELTRGAGGAAPVLHGVGVTGDAGPVDHPTETGR